MKSVSRFPRRLIYLGLSIPVVLLLLVEWLQWRSVNEYRDAREWVTHTRTVMLDLESFLACKEVGPQGRA